MATDMNTAAIDGVAQSAARELARGNARQALKMTRQIMLKGHATTRLLEVDARAALQLGDLDAAIGSIEKAIQAAGAPVERALLYGDLLLRKKRWQAAANVFQQVIKKQDGNVPAWLGLGHCCYGAGDAAKAAGCYRRVLEHEPEHQDAALKLGEALLYLGDARNASLVLEKARQQAPDSAEVAYHYGESLRQSTRIQEAITVFRAHLNAPAWRRRIGQGLIMACMASERLDEAMALTEEFLAEYPGDTALLGYRAKLLAAEGKDSEARAIYESVMENQPNNYAVWEPYMKVREEPLSEALLERLYRDREEARRRNHKRYIAGTHFAARAHYGMTGEVGREMEELNQANAIMAELEPCDFEGHTDKVRQCIRGYTAERLRSLASSRKDERPVFILCPPRSGSTLLEQALARHSAFWSGGESEFAILAWHALTGSYSLTIDVDEQKALDADGVQRFADQSMVFTREAGWPEGVRMVHKAINNYKIAGLLKAAFPEARFVELRRNPLDVAFGCYRQNFSSQPFSHTFEGCAAEVALFQETMDWWQQQMPEAIYRIDYEQLVEDFQGTLTGLLHWLGEEWEPACQDFGREGRVATASANQVRKGLFKEGVGRWKRYEPYLDPLLQAFEKYGVTLEPPRDSQAS